MSVKVHILQRISYKLAAFERRAAGFFAFLVFILILANIVTRVLKLPIFWIDELAIYMMIWMAFLAASASLEAKEHIAVTLFTSKFPEKMQTFFLGFVNTVLLLLGVVLVALAWVWFSPVELVINGFDRSVFSATTLNFIYTEPTAALGLPKVLFWFVMPLFSISVCVHSLALLVSGLSKEEKSS